MIDYIKLDKLVNTPEDEFHDFKEKWHSDNSELVRDILNFVNTVHHEDCYILFGISDEGEVVGISEEHRKSNEDLTDLLHKLFLSTNTQIKVSVDTVKYGEKNIDVLTIYDTDLTPVYLTREYNPKKGKKLPAGLIYSRNGAINTPRSESANFEKINALFKKYNHLDMPILDQFMHVLKDHSNWTYVENVDGPNFIYNLNPDFYMHMRSEDAELWDIEEFSLNLINPNVHWGNLDLIFRHLNINEQQIVHLDSGNISVPVPSIEQYSITPGEGIFYRCYYKNSLQYLLFKLFKNVYPGFDLYSENSFKQSVVFFENLDDKECIHTYIRSIYSKEQLTDRITVDPKEISDELAMVKTRSKHADAVSIEEMIKRNKFVSFVKETQIKYSKEIGK